MSASAPNPVLLLAEDDENDVFFFNRTFRKSGASFVVHRVSNGARAIEFLQNAATSNTLPDVFFLDLKMPMMNGFDVLAWLQNQEFSSSVPVIVLSGSDERRDKDRARELGAVDYLVKPIKMTDFQRVLQEVSQNAAPQMPEDNQRLT